MVTGLLQYTAVVKKHVTIGCTLCEVGHRLVTHISL